MFVVSLRFPNTLLVATVKAASAKPCCLCPPGSGLPGPLTAHRVVRKARVWQQEPREPLHVGLEHNVFVLRSPEQGRAAGSPGCGCQNGLRRLLNSSCFM